MDVHLDLNMTTIGPLDGLEQVEYPKDFGDMYKCLWHEDQIAVPSDRIPALLKWTHQSSGHVWADPTLKLVKKWFHSTWSSDQLRKAL